MENKKKEKKDEPVEMEVKVILENTNHTFNFSTDTTSSFIAASKEAIELIKNDEAQLKRFADKLFFALTDFIKVGLLTKQIQDYKNETVE